MRVSKTFAALGWLLVPLGPAGAQSMDPQASPPPLPPTTVRGVTVTAHPLSVSELVVQARKACFVALPSGMSAPPTPRVVEVYPRPGAVVPAGLAFVRIVFDQPMSRCGYAMMGVLRRPFPDQAGIAPRATQDLKTFVLPVRTRPNQSYSLVVNGRPIPYFRNIFGQAAAEYRIDFTTSDATVDSEQAAAAADPALEALLASSAPPLIELPRPAPARPIAPGG